MIQFPDMSPFIVICCINLEQVGYLKSVSNKMNLW
jgi:hypothetical protein